MIEVPVALVVEDDPGIMMFAADILEGHGFSVLTASSADEGLAVLQSCHDIRVVLTDVFTPGTLDGFGLVSEIRRLWPHKEIIVTSGKMPAEAAGGDKFVFLAKPYDERALIAAVAQVHASHV